MPTALFSIFIPGHLEIAWCPSHLCSWVWLKFTHSEVPTSPLLAQSYQSQLTTLGCRTLVADVPILHRRSHLFELPQDLHDWFPTAEAESHVCFKMASHRRTPFIWVPHFQPLWLDSALASCSVGWFFAPLLVRRSAASIGVQPLWLSARKDAWKSTARCLCPKCSIALHKITYALNSWVVFDVQGISTWASWWVLEVSPARKPILLMFVCPVFYLPLPSGTCALNQNGQAK